VESDRHRWTSSLSEELSFWQHLIAERREEYCQRLTDPARELGPHIARWVTRPRSRWRKLRLLDVGAGPLPALAPRWGGRPVKVVAVDPLAREYAQVLEAHGVRPVVVTRYGEAEQLTTQFGRNRFDLAYASNCLDHCYDPLRAIVEMVNVIRPGCYVVLEHATNEGVANQYRGLHQWNFDREEGEFVVWRPGMRTEVGAMLSLVGTVESEVRDIEGGRQSLSVRIRKHERW
jgi:SAM-dependent methyltransferase